MFGMPKSESQRLDEVVVIGDSREYQHRSADFQASATSARLCLLMTCQIAVLARHQE